MSTIRSILADCQSGDGSQLEVTTEGQDSDAVLKFRITDDDGVMAAAYISAEQLDQITPFIFRERESWEASGDEESYCGDSLEGNDCVLLDEHPGMHVTKAGATWSTPEEEF